VDAQRIDDWIDAQQHNRIGPLLPSIFRVTDRFAVVSQRQIGGREVIPGDRLTAGDIVRL
jgi:hypothetical protein